MVRVGQSVAYKRWQWWARVWRIRNGYGGPECGRKERIETVWQNLAEKLWQWADGLCGGEWMETVVRSVTENKLK